MSRPVRRNRLVYEVAITLAVVSIAFAAVSVPLIASGWRASGTAALLVSVGLAVVATLVALPFLSGRD